MSRKQEDEQSLGPARAGELDPAGDRNRPGLGAAAKPGDAGTGRSEGNSKLYQQLERANLQQYAANFEARGYASLTDLPEDDDKAAQEIAACINDDTKPGVVRRILNLLHELRKPKPERDPVAAPTLKAGEKLDLDAPKLETPDGGEFKLPPELSLPSDLSGPQDASTLSPTDWMVIARHLRLLHGIDLEKVLSGGAIDDAPQAEEAALLWSVPSDGDSWCDARQQGDIHQTVTYSVQMQSLVRSRMVGVSAELSTPFVGASAEASHAEKAARASEEKHLYLNGSWRFKFARLNMNYCTAPAPRFVRAVEDALGKDNVWDRYKALKGIFDRFGYVIPKFITLGGLMTFEKEQVIRGSVEETQVKDAVAAAVQAKVGGTGGGAGVSFSDGMGGTVTSQSICESVDWRAVGGNVNLAGNPGEWRGTAGAAKYWAVVEREGLVDLVSFLDDSLQKQVKAAWKEGLQELWAGHEPPQGHLYPPFAGMPFTIRPYSRTARKILSGPEDSLPVAVIEDDGRDPLDAGRLWRLVFSGKYPGYLDKAGRSVPLFFIVKYDPEVDAQVRRLRPPPKDVPDVPVLCAARSDGAPPFLGTKPLKTALDEQGAPSGGDNLWSVFPHHRENNRYKVVSATCGALGPLSFGTTAPREKWPLAGDPSSSDLGPECIVYNID